MALLTWDDVGERLYETGVDKGVLYIPDEDGDYANGVAWSGLTNVTESPSGASPTFYYTDNTKYLTLFSTEEFEATLEAFSYPEEFERFDGYTELLYGVSASQQERNVFGLCYRTLLGNDVVGSDYGYKLHLVYGCMAAPSEKAYNTINESPDVINFSWAISTIPVDLSGLNPTSVITIDSTKQDPENLELLELVLYGGLLYEPEEGDPFYMDPRLPLPGEVVNILEGSGITYYPPDTIIHDGGTA